MGHSQLGQILIKRGLLTEADRQTINRTCGATPGAFAKGVLALGLMSEAELAALIAAEARVAQADPGLADSASGDALSACGQALVDAMEFIPIEVDSDTITAAMLDPLDKSTVRRLEFFTGKRIKPVVTTLTQLHAYMQQRIDNYEPRSTGLEDFLKHHTAPTSDSAENSADERIEVAQAISKKISTKPQIGATSAPAKAATDEDWNHLERLSQEHVEPSTIKNLPPIDGDEHQHLDAASNADEVIVLDDATVTEAETAATIEAEQELPALTQPMLDPIAAMDTEVPLAIDDDVSFATPVADLVEQNASDDSSLDANTPAAFGSASTPQIDVAALNLALWKLEMAASRSKAAEILAKASGKTLRAGAIVALSETSGDVLCSWSVDDSGKIHIKKSGFEKFAGEGTLAALNMRAAGFSDGFVDAEWLQALNATTLSTLIVETAEQKLTVIAADDVQALTNPTYAELISSALRKCLSLGSA